MLNNTETRTNDKINAYLPLETRETPADTLTDDGLSENASTFEFECEPIYPFRIWCLPDASKEPPSDTHAIEMQTQTPETEIPDLTPDLA